MSLSSGTRLGPYEMRSPLGAGGMVDVYLARDTRLDRTVAIKVARADRPLFAYDWHGWVNDWSRDGWWVLSTATAGRCHPTDGLFSCSLTLEALRRRRSTSSSTGLSC